jgi:hypothetical protein
VRRAKKLLAEVAELADAHGSGPCTRKGVGVRVPSSAPFFWSSKNWLWCPLGVRLRPSVFPPLRDPCSNITCPVWCPKTSPLSKTEKTNPARASAVHCVAGLPGWRIIGRAPAGIPGIRSIQEGLSGMPAPVGGNSMSCMRSVVGSLKPNERQATRIVLWRPEWSRFDLRLLA